MTKLLLIFTFKDSKYNRLISLMPNLTGMNNNKGFQGSKEFDIISEMIKAVFIAT